MLLEYAPVSGAASIVEHLGILYGLEFSEQEVEAAIVDLAESGRILAISDELELAVETRLEIDEMANASIQREAIVLAEWRLELLQRHPTLADSDLEAVK